MQSLRTWGQGSGAPAHRSVAARVSVRDARTGVRIITRLETENEEQFLLHFSNHTFQMTRSRLNDDTERVATVALH